MRFWITLAVAFVCAASSASAEDKKSDVKTAPIPGVDKLPPGFEDQGTGIITGPPGSYGNAHNGLPDQSHGKCVIVAASHFRAREDGETHKHYSNYIRTEIQKQWRQQFGKEGDAYTLHEGVVVGYQPGRGYSVCAVTCAPVPFKAHEKAAVADPKPADPTKPGSGGGGYHMPGTFFGPHFGVNQHGGCSLAAHEWANDPTKPSVLTYPLGAPDHIQNIPKPPRPTTPPPAPGGPKPGTTPTVPPTSTGGPKPPTVPPPSGGTKPPKPPKPPATGGGTKPPTTGGGTKPPPTPPGGSGGGKPK
ncbi:MAG: hypothetical protein ABI867_27445 [Kofleriaceae bacterium]